MKFLTTGNEILDAVVIESCCRVVTCDGSIFRTAPMDQ